MRATLVALFLLSSLSEALAQECVSCRSDRCKGMFWIPACQAAAKPAGKPAGASGTKHDRGCPAEKPLKLEVDFPPKLTEGDLLGIRIRTSCEAWLIVYYLEDKGPGAVIWPSKLEPAPSAGPSHPASLPSPREATASTRIEAQLRTPGVAAHETFLVFALADRATFDRVRPKSGTQQPDGDALTAQLTSKLASVPANRWAQFMAHYTIEPRHE